MHDADRDADDEDAAKVTLYTDDEGDEENEQDEEDEEDERRGA